MLKHAFGGTVMASALIAMTTAALADPVPLTSNRDIHIAVSNDAGARYGSGPDDTYWLNAPGGGLNQLHITTDGTVAGLSGQVTTQTISPGATSGSFYVSTTGGRGYNDDIILGVSLQGPIANDFALTVKSSGYQWTASTAGVVNPVYVQGAVNETFTQADFRYGPNTAKPGPGNGWILPFYSGQDINDPATAQLLMFIDLDVGNDNDRTAIDSGDAKVEFDVSGLLNDDILSFNAYAWAFSANVADASINWTNNLSTDPNAPGQSGYSVQAVPEPGTLALFAAGLVAIAGLGRGAKRKAAAPV
jgi:hypothetical protein